MRVHMLQGGVTKGDVSVTESVPPPATAVEKLDEDGSTKA